MDGHSQQCLASSSELQGFQLNLPVLTQTPGSRMAAQLSSSSSKRHGTDWAQTEPNAMWTRTLGIFEPVPTSSLGFSFRHVWCSYTLLPTGPAASGLRTFASASPPPPRPLIFTWPNLTYPLRVCSNIPAHPHPPPNFPIPYYWKLKVISPLAPASNTTSFSEGLKVRTHGLSIQRAISKSPEVGISQAPVPF